MEGSRVGGWGKPGRAPAQVGQRLEENKVAKKLVGAPRQRRRGDLPGWSRGIQSMGRGGSARGGAGGCALTQQIREPPERPARRPQRPGWDRRDSSAPSPGPAAVTRPPSGCPALPTPSRRRPPPEPSPGNASSPTASSWRGRGPGGRPGEEGTGGGEAESESEAGLGAAGERTGAGAGGGSSLGGAGAQARGRRRPRPEPAPPPPARTPPGAPSLACTPASPGPLSPAFPHPHPASASRALDTWGN